MSRPTVYKCDSCGKIGDDPDEFREFIGNVHAPDGGGLIGNSIFTGVIDKDPSEIKRGDSIYESEDGTVRIYSLDYCVVCCARILKLPSPTTIR